METTWDEILRVLNTGKKALADTLKDAKKEAGEGNVLDVFYLLKQARIVAKKGGININHIVTAIWDLCWKARDERNKVKT